MDTKTEKLYKLIMNSHIDKFKGIFDDINQQYKSKFDDLKVEIINMLCNNESVNGLIKQNEELETKNKELSEKLAQTEAVRKDAVDSLYIIQEKNEELTEKLTKKLELAESVRNETARTLATKEQQCVDLEMMIKLFSNKNDSLQSTNSGLLQQLDQAETEHGELMEELVETQSLYEETVTAQKKVQTVCDAYEVRYEEMKEEKSKLVSDYNLLNSSYAALKHKHACLERKMESLKKQSPAPVQSNFDVNKLIGKWISDDYEVFIITLRPCCKNFFNVENTYQGVSYTLKYDNDQLYILELGKQVNVTWFTDGAYQYLKYGDGILKKKL